MDVEDEADGATRGVTASFSVIWLQVRFCLCRTRGLSVLDEAATAATVEDTEAEDEVCEEEVLLAAAVELVELVVEDDLPTVVAECDACGGAVGSSWYLDS